MRIYGRPVFCTTYCGLLLLFSSRYIFFSHYFYTLLLFTLPLLSRLLLRLLIFLCYHSFHAATLFALLFFFALLLLLSHCYSFPVVLLALFFLSPFKQLLANLYCSSRTTIPDPFTLLLLCFVWLVWYFPCPCHVLVGVQRPDTNSTTKCEFFCIFSIFLRFFLLLLHGWLMHR